MGELKQSSLYFTIIVAAEFDHRKPQYIVTGPAEFRDVTFHDMPDAEAYRDKLIAKYEATLSTTLSKENKRLREALAFLMPAPVDETVKDGPCCHDLEEHGGKTRWVLTGCDCGNRDDASFAGAWAARANQRLDAEERLAEMGLNIGDLSPTDGGGDE